MVEALYIAAKQDKEQAVATCVQAQLQADTLSLTCVLKANRYCENDIWIAAITLQYNLTLVTRDAHFREVENLQTITW